MARANPFVSGALTTVGNTLDLSVPSSDGVVVSVTGTATFNVVGEVSLDNGTTWVDVVGVRIDLPLAVTALYTIADSSMLLFPALGADKFRLRVVGIVVAGTLTAKLRGTAAFTPPVTVVTSTSAYPGNSLPHTSLAAGSAVVANGTALDNYPTALKGVAPDHSLVVVAGVGVTGGVVALQGSLDNINFVQLGTLTLTAAGTTHVAVAGVAMRYVRAAITTAVVGGTITATVASAG